MQTVFEGRSRRTADLAACRFCLKISKFQIQIDEEIKTKYQNLMNEELLETPKLSHNCCKSCVSELEQCVSTKNKIFSNQKFLLELVGLKTKQEPDFEYSRQFPNNIVKTEIEEVEEEINYGIGNMYTEGNQTPSPMSDKFEEFFEVKEEEFPDKVECDICGKFILNTDENLKKHNRKFHPSRRPKRRISLKKEQWRKEKVSCPDCGIIVNRASLYNHQKNIHGAEKLICDLCGFGSKNKNAMITHMKTTHSENVYKCDLCPRTYTSEKLFKKHGIKAHGDSSKLICDYCGIQLTCLEGYNGHIRAKHTKEKPFICTFCPKAFHSSSGLNHHKEKHHTDNIVTCEVCGKTFTSKISLREHRRFVHAEKKFVCHIEGCIRKYSALKLLQKHLYTHLDIKRVVCTVCDRPFKNRSGIEKHIHAVHLNLKLECFVENCTATFHRRDYLQTHIKKHHASLGQAEVDRLMEETRKIKLPAIGEYYKVVDNSKNYEIFKNIKTTDDSQKDH